MICRLSSPANIRTKKEFLITKPTGYEHVDWRSEAKRIPGPRGPVLRGYRRARQGSGWRLAYGTKKSTVVRAPVDSRLSVALDCGSPDLS